MGRLEINLIGANVVPTNCQGNMAWIDNFEADASVHARVGDIIPAQGFEPGHPYGRKTLKGAPSLHSVACFIPVLSFPRVGKHHTVSLGVRYDTLAT